MMLSLEEFSVGMFSDAALGNLILPRGDDEAAAIIGLLEETPWAVFLDKHNFASVPAGEANWGGIIVRGVRLEVDEQSATEPYGRVSLGSVVRSGTTLALRAQLDERNGRATYITLISGLPDIRDAKAIFGRWSVVIGEGQDKRTLIDVRAVSPQQ
jgi:hypothetical protein